MCSKYLTVLATAVDYTIHNNNNNNNKQICIASQGRNFTGATYHIQTLSHINVHCKRMYTKNKIKLTMPN